jgi:hypothetical protein
MHRVGPSRALSADSPSHEEGSPETVAAETPADTSIVLPLLLDPSLKFMCIRLYQLRLVIVIVSLHSACLILHNIVTQFVFEKLHCRCYVCYLLCM